MIKSIKTGIILLAALLLAWLLPWCYAFVFASPSWSPFTLYSCVTHGFASVDFDRENNVAGRDLQGNTYTQQQFDSILPTFYYRQLAAEGRFPSEIEGVAVESRDVERTNFMFRTSPGEINRRRPTVYQLLGIDARPHRFRTGDGRVPHHRRGNRVRRYGDQHHRPKEERGIQPKSCGTRDFRSRPASSPATPRRASGTTTATCWWTTRSASTT